MVTKVQTSPGEETEQLAAPLRCFFLDVPESCSGIRAPNRLLCGVKNDPVVVPCVGKLHSLLSSLIVSFVVKLAIFCASLQNKAKWIKLQERDKSGFFLRTWTVVTFTACRFLSVLEFWVHWGWWCLGQFRWGTVDVQLSGTPRPVAVCCFNLDQTTPATCEKRVKILGWGWHGHALLQQVLHIHCQWACICQPPFLTVITCHSVIAAFSFCVLIWKGCAQNASGRFLRSCPSFQKKVEKKKKCEVRKLWQEGTQQSAWGWTRTLTFPLDLCSPGQVESVVERAVLSNLHQVAFCGDRETEK